MTNREPILVTGGECDVYIGDRFVGSVTSIAQDSLTVDIGYLVHSIAPCGNHKLREGGIAIVEIDGLHTNDRELTGKIICVIPANVPIPSKYDIARILKEYPLRSNDDQGD